MWPQVCQLEGVKSLITVCGLILILIVNAHFSALLKLLFDLREGLIHVW